MPGPQKAQIAQIGMLQSSSATGQPPIGVSAGKRSQPSRTLTIAHPEQPIPRIDVDVNGYDDADYDSPADAEEWLNDAVDQPAGDGRNDARG